MKKIIITDRGYDFHAHIQGASGKWGSGATTDSAVGSLIQSWPEDFGIELEDAKEFPPQAAADPPPNVDDPDDDELALNNRGYV
jgi:hypothetical protein